ncbi:hypothetical protein, partial [Klebsiella variicola]|uniref:hypothetical protein n=1 Tax=Klebsiella variicola TaxID=244366 RepID=UPI001ADE33CF
VGSGTDNVAEFRNSSNTLLARVREDGYLFGTNVTDDDQHAALGTAGLRIGGGSLLAWSNNAYSWETLDAGISRTAAATLAVGNGTA